MTGSRHGRLRTRPPGADPGTDRLVRTGLTATAGIVLAGTGAQLLSYAFAGGRIPALDSVADGGVFGAVGDASLAAAAVAAWAVLVRVRPTGAAAVALPPLLTFLAVDKTFRLHDHVPHWLVVYLPLLLAAFVCLVVVGLLLSPRCLRLVVAGLALLAGSFLIHLYGEWFLSAVGASPTTGWPVQLKAAVKHGSEVAGWLVIALGLAAGLRDRTGRHPTAP
jgi:hypothetical protein